MTEHTLAELLKELKAVTDHLEAVLGGPLAQAPTIRSARKAIAKAEGRDNGK